MMLRTEIESLRAKYRNEGLDFLRRLGFSRFDDSAAKIIVFLYVLLSRFDETVCCYRSFDVYRQRAGANNGEYAGGIEPFIEEAAEWAEAKHEFAKKYVDGTDLIKACILFCGESGRDFKQANCLTPEICRLIAKLVIPAKGNFINLCMGRGNFMRDGFAGFESHVNFEGYEEDATDFLCSLIRAEILDLPLDILHCRALLEANGEYDAFFAALPLAGRSNAKISENSLAESFKNCNRQLWQGETALGTCEWFYAGYLADRLNYNGKGALIVASSALFRTVTREVKAREYMLKKGWISAVIEIANRRLYRNTGANACIVLLGACCREVRFVYADLEEKRAGCMLADEEIADIAAACESGEAKGNFGAVCFATKSVDEILSLRDCPLQPSFHTAEPVSDRMIKLKEWLAEGERGIIRSRIFSSKDIQEYYTGEKTLYKYLDTVNIENGVIGGKIQCLKKMPDMHVYCLQEGDIVVSRMASPTFKVAVAEFETGVLGEGSNVFTGSNLYVIRTDRQKANPYYIKAWLESSFGQKELKRASNDGTLSMLRVIHIENLYIPWATLAEQEEFANEYRKKCGEMAEIRAQLDAKAEEFRNFAESTFARIIK